MNYQAPQDLPTLKGFEELSLEELVKEAPFHVRRDRKYLLPNHLVSQLLAALSPSAQVLTINSKQWFSYQSVYFDTPDYVSYLAAARRRPRRWKVRTRAYLDSEICTLEVKTRGGRGHTVKTREPYPMEDRFHLNEHAIKFLGGFELIAPQVEALVPTLTTQYERTTLLVDEGSAKVTVDTRLMWRASNNVELALPGYMLFETKTEGPPSSIDRQLWRLGNRPVKFSKYCTGLAALTPQLPANKWHRILSRYSSEFKAVAPVGSAWTETPNACPDFSRSLHS